MNRDGRADFCKCYKQKPESAELTLSDELFTKENDYRFSYIDMSFWPCIEYGDIFYQSLAPRNRQRILKSSYVIYYRGSSFKSTTPLNQAS